MSKKKRSETAKIPKKVLSFKLSKGSRKDLRKLLKLVEGPEIRGIAISAASVALGFLAEKTVERKGPPGKRAGKTAGRAQAN